MKRDMELMRKILLAIEEQHLPGTGSILNLKVEGFKKEEVAEHCKLLYQAGLIDDYKPHYAGNTLVHFGIGNLTNDGYDYLELIRNEETWEKTREKVKEKNLPDTIETYGKIAASIIGTFIRELTK